jgi:membrane protease subunit (stomatin/prohibitin family)
MPNFEKSISFAALLTLVFIFFSFAIDTEKGDASCEKRKGVYVYILSTPKNNYEVIGSVKKVLTWSNRNEELLSELINKAKKDFNNCDGIIISDISMDKADVIKFK